MNRERTLGITVLADYICSEGVESVLRNVIERLGANAVALNPTVSAPAAEGTGSFQPPSDAGTSPRVFDRPLWGETSLWVRSAPSFEPNRTFYADTPYQPRQADDLTGRHGGIIEQFIDEALRRGLKVYLQINASTPPTLRAEDVPQLPNGKIPKRMAEIGSLASPAIRAYTRAYLRDLLGRYPQITGFRPDWPEYPCYMLEEAFQDFGPHVGGWAESRGFDFERMRVEVGTLFDYLHGTLTTKDLQQLAAPDLGMSPRAELMQRFPAAFGWLQLKRALSLDLLCHWRDSITAYGGTEKELSANAFMPPLSHLTGFDFSGAVEYCNAVSPKLYTMHWTAMVDFWGTELLAQNRDLDEPVLVAALTNLFDLGAGNAGKRIADYGYPEPQADHPVSEECQARRIAQVHADVDGGCQVTPIVHGYGPFDDFCRRFRVAAANSPDGLWINRYGYLSDEKLDAVGDLWKS